VQIIMRSYIIWCTARRTVRLFKLFEFFSTGNLEL